MYSNNFVVAIKVNGKVLREVQDVVYLPFGTEYTILLKNTSPQKAQVNVNIDGQDATEGVMLIVDGNETFELKRFIKNGNLKAGNSFKFIEKTAQIEEFRGNKAEDGLVTISYEFEKKCIPSVYDNYPWSKLGGSCVGTNIRTHAYYNASLSSSGVQFTNTSCSSSDSLEAYTTSANILRSAKTKTAGITAPGKPVEQEFRTVAAFVTDGVKHSMTVQLKGTDGKQEPVVEAIVVKKVQRCTMCGANAKQTAKFCSQCGASVEIV